MIHVKIFLYLITTPITAKLVQQLVMKKPCEYLPESDIANRTLGQQQSHTQPQQTQIQQTQPQQTHQQVQPTSLGSS